MSPTRTFWSRCLWLLALLGWAACPVAALAQDWPSKALTRRTSRRSWAINATGAPCADRSARTWAAASCASSSKPPHTCTWTRARGATARMASSPRGSASIHSTGQAPDAASTSCLVKASTPPAWTTIHADGCIVNRASVSGAVVAAAHSKAMRAR